VEAEKYNLDTNHPPTLFVGRNYIFLPETTSTNATLKSLYAKSSLPEGTVLITSYQTEGRGQAGTTWESEKDTNIMLSVLLYPKFIAVADQFMISKAMALAVHDLVSTLLPDTEVNIKWPNDILVSGKKICGILIENGLKANAIEYCICGIGININQWFEDQTRTSLKTITGVEYDLEYLEKQLFSCIEARYLKLKQNPAAISKDYLDVLYGFGKKSKFRIPITDENFEGTICGINTDGRLMIKTAEGVKIFGLKEVSLIS